jgi:hypothetical protein
VASFTGDGTYDQDSVYRAVVDRDRDAAVIVPPRSTATPGVTAATKPTQRDGRTLHVRKTTAAEPALRRIYELLGIEANPGGVQKLIV